MKKLFFSRKQILRAINVAALALSFWAAQQHEVQAQSFAPQFQVAGSTVTTASGNYGTGAGLYEPNAAYTTFTIASGTTINSAAAYGGSNLYNVDPYSLITTSTAAFSNAGSLTLTTGSADYNTTVFLNQMATSIVATNSGTINSTQTAGGNVDMALEIISTTGNIALTNSGTLSITGGNNPVAFRALSSAGGDIVITNTANGIVTAGANGNGFYATTSGAGTVNFDNAGNISSGGAAVAMVSEFGDIAIVNSGTITSTVSVAVAAQSNTGNISVLNSGHLAGSQYGVAAYSNDSVTLSNTGSVSSTSSSGMYASAATILETNSGTITSSNSGLSAHQSALGTITLVNSGEITSSDYGIRATPFVGSGVTVTNSGLINVSNTGILLNQPGNVINSGSITAPTAINVPSGSGVTLSGSAVVNGLIQGGATSASTSTLTFNLGIPAAQLAAAQTQLNAEIAAYNAQNGGAYTFVIDGKTFDILNFLYGNGGITDDLVIPPMTRMYANTPGFRSLGSVLDALPSNATSTQILTALNALPDSAVSTALAELSPKELQIFRNIAFDNNTFNAGNVNNHLANLRDGLTGFDDSQMTVQDGSMDSSLNQVRSHLLAFNPAPNAGLINDSADSILGGLDMKDTRLNTEPVDRWSSFISGDVILANTSHNTDLADADYTTGNVTGGLDYRLSKNFTVGALFAYAHTDANLDNRGSSATVDSYSPGIYASYVDGGWYANALGAYTRNAYTEDRQIDIAGLGGNNHGATSGNQGSINLTGGYEFQKGSFKFGPVASLQYVRLSIDTMTEQGPTALDIASQDQDSLRTLLGLEGRFSTKVSTFCGPMILTPHVSASWQHEYLDNSQGINADFTGTGGGSFATQTDRPDRDSAFFDIGLDAAVSKNVTLFVDYEAQAGQENFFAQAARGGVRIGF
jgi:fibronectin-binding autotransporter adhesin